jgi:hypothetical protein
VLEPRRPWRTPTTSTQRLGALAAVAVLILSLTSCGGDPEPVPTVSPPSGGPTTTVVLPSPSSTTVVLPSPSSTTVVLPSPSSTTVVLPNPSSTTIVLTPAPNEVQWTFVVVRHANRADDGAHAPLTEAGEMRARRLADLIFSYAGVATYATRFRTAQETARPTAVLWKVPVTTYDVALAPADLISQIKRQHPKGAILIVGHGDTVPGIVTELCRCRIGPIPASDYANKYEVTQRSDGSVLGIDHKAGY